MEVSLRITRRMPLARGGHSAASWKMGNMSMLNCCRGMGRRREMTSCSGSPEGVWEGAVGQSPCTSLALLGLLGEVLPAFCSTALALVGFPFLWAQQLPFSPLRFSYKSFLSGTHPLQPSHTRMFFCRATVTWDLKINESHSRFLPSWDRQGIPGSQSLHSHCICEFKIKNRFLLRVMKTF